VLGLETKIRMKSQQKAIEQIIELAKADDSIEVVWLYGSRAKGTASDVSDYDLAIALNNKINELKTDFYCEQLADEWSQQLASPISIVDINKIPTPLAYNVINEGVVIESNNDFRRHLEQQRIWSLWENYEHEYERHRK